MSKRMVDYSEGEIGNFRIIEDFLPPPEDLVRKQDVAARFIVYRDAEDNWRWTLEDGDGQRLANSPEGYEERHDCISAIELLRLAVHAPLHEAA